MKKPIRIMLASAAINAGVLLASPASAETAAPAEAQISLVRTADLDLSSQAGRRQLDSRLVHAVREVCGTASDADLQGKNEVRRCRLDTLAEARGQTDRLIAAADTGIVIAVSAAR